MTIVRKYETRNECVGLFMEECFDAFPSWTVTDQEEFRERWTFDGLMDGEDTDDEDELGMFGATHPPMWNTWFIPDSGVHDFAKRNPEEVAGCGFTLIYNDGDLFALGVDGAGYSFRDRHFARLYDAMGISWHGRSAA